MNLQNVYHQPKSRDCYAYDEATIHIRIRVDARELSGVILVYGDKFEWNGHREAAMQYCGSEGSLDYFTAEIPYMSRLAYYFKLVGGQETAYFTQWGLEGELEEKRLHFYYFQYPYVHKSSIHKVPDWVKDSVFYEIFPDRFYNANKANDPDQVGDWRARPSPGTFYGGDLEGIIEKISYLKDLGINAIYLTPIFQSGSNHKYDTINYFAVDPQLGDLDTLKRLVALCHENGIRVMLDGVFNHCSSRSPQFQDVCKRGSASPYYHWFHIRGLPVETSPPNYEMFSTVWDMPKLNTENKEVRDYLLSAVRYWMEQTDIDGWRLDVADELDARFLRELRETVKQYRADAYILGEAWHNDASWLMGDQLDAVMNYRFAMACMDYFACHRLDTKGFVQKINRVRMDYTQQVSEVLFNLIESHDTSRFLTLCGGDARKLMLAAIFQLTFQGAPCIYYGTEIGIEGGEDPDCRRTFPWEESDWNMEVYRYLRKLIHLRREYPALRRGSFVWLENEEGILAYERRLENQVIMVMINNREEKMQAAIPLEQGTAMDLLTGQTCILEENAQNGITIPGLSARLLLIG